MHIECSIYYRSTFRLILFHSSVTSRNLIFRDTVGELSENNSITIILDSVYTVGMILIY
jgi:hypothetical protein